MTDVNRVRNVVSGFEEEFRFEFKSDKSLLQENALVRRQKNIKTVKSFNLVKRAIWSCVFLQDEDADRKDDK